MSTEATTETVKAETGKPKEGFIRCPKCGYEIPDNLVICWKCGAIQK